MPSIVRRWVNLHYAFLSIQLETMAHLFFLKQTKMEKINANLVLIGIVIGMFIGLFAVLIYVIFLFKKLKYEPKDWEDIELENAYINSLKVKDAEIVKPKATTTHNAYGKIEDNE